MKTRYAVALAAAFWVGIGSVACAADMTGAEIKAFLSGKTSYLETTAASVAGQVGQAKMFLAEDGTVFYKKPDDGMLHGKWEIRGNTLCIDWKDTPDKNACARYDKTGDTVTILDGATGQVRAKIVKTASGNAEQLMP